MLRNLQAGKSIAGINALEFPIARRAALETNHERVEKAKNKKKQCDEARIPINRFKNLPGPHMFVDIAFNATSSYYEKSLADTMRRAAENGVMPIIVGLDTASSLQALDLAEKYNTLCYFGIHPLHLGQDNGQIMEHLQEHLHAGKIIAVGECGLDYYRADNRPDQMVLFRAQLRAGRRLALPFFLHCREAHSDFVRCIDEELSDGEARGVVHSFDGSLDEATALISRGFYIGINGCSMRSEESLQVVREIPLEKILLETDSPYCLIRRSYCCARYTTLVAARNNEPCHISCVAEALANIKGIEPVEVEKAVYNNTLRLFPKVAECAAQWKRGE